LLGLASALSYAQAPVPFINLPLVPDATAPGGPQFTLTVNGTGFVSNSVVDWNGSARATTFVSSSRLTATILATDIARRGTGQVTVVDPGSGSGGGTSNAIPFEVTQPVLPLGFNNSEYPLGGFNASLLVADFNGDGNLDIAAESFEGTTVSIYLGDGHGLFQHYGDYPTGVSDLDEMAVGDFNGDGKLDLASRSGVVLLGNGDGSFQPPLLLPIPAGSDLVAVDFNGDGKLDLAITDGFDGNVYVLLGNGDGTFQAPVSYVAGSGAYGVVAGDFNGDGKLDLGVLLTDTNEVAILLGNGDGTFRTPLTYPTIGIGPWELYAADLNGDGALDLVVPISDGVSVLLGNGDGTFGPPTEYSVKSAYGRGGIADVNGDGIPDLVLTSGWYGGATLYVLLGKGDGTFMTPRSYTNIGTCPFGTAFGDFNKDGILDMAFADWCSSEFTVSLGAVVQLQPDTLAFGTVSVGQQASLNATLTNVRKSTLQIAQITIPGAKSPFSQANNCGNSVGAGQSCTITVTFTPPRPGSYESAVEVQGQAPGSPQMIFLSGTAPKP
jgi:hypothetical protein